ncbi:MAG: glycoside hydrolase family 16 protein, partial [Paramuribaculum sp.]|nr:glycoside hydrolase family 16 protein [Paramuribaculum sp.]
MKIFTKYLGLCGMAMLSTALQAQTISFETKDYKTLGVYDTWAQSPFRTGALEGNVSVVDNHLADASSNTSGKILGVQRSRLGSNTFGVRIDLNETFELTPEVKYCHIMIHKPTSGRVMLIGLGKRADRAEQSTEVEQFWAYPINDVKANEWFDAVFPIKGNGGIDIYSLVLVPDCEAPHTLSSDFVAYIDEIVIDKSLNPRFGVGDYPVNFSPSAGWGRDDRKITAL